MSSTSPPDTTLLRLRAFLDAQFVVIAVVCLLASAAGAGLVYTTHIDPGTETETRTVSPFTVETEYVHSATVIEQNPVFETGAVLSGRNTYFTGVAPVLDVGVETQYTAATASGVNVSVSSELLVRNVGEDGEVVYWSDRRPLASQQFSGVDPGETVDLSFALNTSAIGARAASIDEALGGSPGETEVVVVTRVAVDGTFGGDAMSHTQTIEMTVVPGEGTYSVTDLEPQSTGPERTERVTSRRSYGPFRSIGGPGLYFVGSAGIGVLLYARRKGMLALTPEEEAYLTYRDDQSEFAEWITRIRLPDSVFERPQAEAATLRDLVDFAIDNDAGVVEDPETGLFYVVTDEFVYTYRPPSPVNAAANDAPSDATDDTPPDSTDETSPESTDDTPSDADTDPSGFGAFGPDGDATRSNERDADGDPQDE